MGLGPSALATYSQFLSSQLLPGSRSRVLLSHEHWRQDTALHQLMDPISLIQESGYFSALTAIKTLNKHF